MAQKRKSRAKDISSYPKRYCSICGGEMAAKPLSRRFCSKVCKIIAYRQEHPEYFQSRYKENPEKYIAAAKRNREKYRDICLAHYGRKCRCCGETVPKFLTFDHVNNDGFRHRKEIGKGTHALYKWIIEHRFPDTIQILCWNCNCGKNINDGVCPHMEVRHGTAV